MACSPKCPYFPKVELDMQYKVDCFGVKRKIQTISKPTCMYDLSSITKWDKVCPRLENLNKLTLSAMKG